jgi:hypothetical protein
MNVPGLKQIAKRSPGHTIHASLRHGKPGHFMTKLCIFLGTTVGGYGFWFIGDALGLSFFMAFLLSGVGSVAGVWAGWKLAQKLDE